MEKRIIETTEDFEMAMGAVQSSIQLLDMFDWQNWLEKESFFQGAGAVINPEIFLAMQKDPQWDQKVAVFRAAATYMGAIENIRSSLGGVPDEG